MNHPTPRSKILLAFITLYIVWGSTYLAIRIGVGSLPPLLFAAPRWLLAGIAFYLYAYSHGQRPPRSWREWRVIIFSGVLLIVGGNGLVVIGEQWVSSSLAALIVASAALWIAGFGAVGAQGEPVSPRARWGLVLGFVGVAILLWPKPTDFGASHLLGEAAVALASILWALGTVQARRARPRTPALMSTALQSLIGGAILALWGFSAGEGAAWHWSASGLAALAYLTLFGSLGFGTYVWLTHETTPAKLGTYAYVNPAIAVLLGWWLLGETLGLHQLFGMAVVLIGVILVTTGKLAPLKAVV